MTTCCMCGLKTSRDDGLCSPCRMGSVASEHVDRSETDRDPMNYDVACVIREGDMGTRAEDHRRPTATATKTDRDFILDDMSGHAENDCECHNHEDCNRAMAQLVRRLLVEERRERATPCSRCNGSGSEP